MTPPEKAKKFMTKSRKANNMAKLAGGSADPSKPTNGMPLNFKVSAEFRRDFKTYAAQHNKKLNQLLYEAFAALKAQHVE